MLGVPVVLASTSVTSTLASCSWASSDTTAPASTPAETPADVPDPLTPIPVTTPTPDPIATPTPTPAEIDEPVEQVFRVAVEEFPIEDQLVPATSTCTRVPIVMAGLTRVSPDFTIEPDWAEDWEPRDDGSRWIFHIRRNEAGWSNGEPVTAHDFVTAWRRLLDPEARSSYGAILYDVQNARDVHVGELPPEDLGVRALDDWTLEVSLERVRVSFPALTSSPLLIPVAAPNEVPSEDEESQAAGCHSNGPYRITETRDEGLVLVPFDRYWESNATPLDRVEISFSSPDQALTMFHRDEVDLIRLDDRDLPRARADGRLSGDLNRGVPTRIWCLIPQVGFPPFEEINVRRALGRVIDRRRLELIVEGRVSQATKLVPSGLFPEYDGASPELELQFDVDTALEEIEQTPYADPGLWPEFNLAIPEGDPFREQVAQDVLEQLYENLGLEIELAVLDPEEYAQGVRERRFPLTWLEWTYRYPDPSCAYADLFASWSHIDSPLVWDDLGYDELARLADALEEPDDRAELYARCEELLQDRAVYIPLVHPVEHYLLQPWVSGAPISSRGRLVQPGPIFTRFADSLEITERT